MERRQSARENPRRAVYSLSYKQNFFDQVVRKIRPELRMIYLGKWWLMVVSKNFRPAGQRCGLHRLRVQA